MDTEQRVLMLEHALAIQAAWIRDFAQCPMHQHVDTVLLTHDGATPWHGPSCEILEFDCPHRVSRDGTLDIAYEALGTRDLSRWLVV